MTLREEVLNLTEDKRLTVNLGNDKRLNKKYFFNLFNQLLRFAAVKYEGSRHDQLAFLESDFYDSWKKKNIAPIIKEHGKIAQDAWDEWEKRVFEKL